MGVTPMACVPWVGGPWHVFRGWVGHGMCSVGGWAGVGGVAGGVGDYQRVGGGVGWGGVGVMGGLGDYQGVGAWVCA